MRIFGENAFSLRFRAFETNIPRQPLKNRKAKSLLRIFGENAFPLRFRAFEANIPRQPIQKSELKNSLFNLIL